MSARFFLLLCAATIPASFGLLQDGFFASSDGMIHLYRVFELDRALHAGIFYPRWFPLSGYGYGLPVLNFYSPLAYYLAEFFHLLGAGYIASIKLLIAFGFILAALSMFLFCRDLLGSAPALVASIAFVYLPYLLSDAYIRGNFSEFLAMALIPLALYAFRELYATHNLAFFIFAALAFAAIILTHHLTAMLAAPLIAAYVVFLFATQHDWEKFLACIGAFSFSLTLSAFYWVPAIAELNLVYVGPASLPRFLVSRLVSVENFFTPSLAYNYLPQSDALLHATGFPQTVLALLAIIAIAVSLRGAQRSHPQLSPAIFFLGVLILSIFLMLDLSAPLYFAIPTLRFLQFPWRFQVIAGISIAFLIGVCAQQMSRITNYQLQTISQSLLSLSLIALAIVNLPVRAIPLTDAQLDLQHSDDPDYVAAQMGWGWTREFVPATVQEESVVGPQPRAPAPAPDSPRTAPSVRIENEGLLSRTARVSTPEPFEISMHAFYFPGWQAYVDGAPARTYPSGNLGLTAVSVPSGDHTVAFRFEETPFRGAMDLISAIAFVGIAAQLFVAHRRATITAMILLALIFVAHTRADAAAQPIALSTDFAHQAMLIGYSTEKTSDAVYVTLYWFALAEMDRDYVSFVHLIGAGGENIAQNDSVTDQGVTPTTRWRRGEIIADHHALKNIPRGNYRLVTGMYLPRENGFANLAAYDRAGNAIGNQAELGAVEVGR